VYVPGKNLVVADTLSRAPLHRVDEQDKVAGVQLYVDTLVAKSLFVARLSEVRQATAVDSELRAVIGYTLAGWPKSSKALPENLRRYFTISDHLSVSDGLLLYYDRIYIPRSLQANLLERIHDGHQGVTKCRDRARSCIYWLGISQYVKTYVDSCSFCQENQRRLQHEPLIPTPLPSGPWRYVAADLFEYDGRHHIHVIDFYSRFMEIAPLRRTTTSEVVAELKAIFARWGIPESMLTDNGPQFSSHEFLRNFHNGTASAM